PFVVGRRSRDEVEAAGAIEHPQHVQMGKALDVYQPVGKGRQDLDRSEGLVLGTEASRNFVGRAVRRFRKTNRGGRKHPTIVRYGRGAYPTVNDTDAARPDISVSTSAAFGAFDFVDAGEIPVIAWLSVRLFTAKRIRVAANFDAPFSVSLRRGCGMLTGSIGTAWCRLPLSCHMSPTRLLKKPTFQLARLNVSPMVSVSAGAFCDH